MTIDIFQKDGTAHGIFVFERGTLFIALGQKGAARPTSIERGDRTRLLVLHRANPKTDRGKDVKDAAKEYEKEFLKAINSKTDRGEDQKAILKWINSKADRGKDQKDAAEKGQQSEKSRPRSPSSQKEW
jgi:hypothetical protein